MTMISGRVVDADGRSVAGARVMLTAAPGPVPDMALLTGADGGFVVGATLPGRYTIAAATDAAIGERSVQVGAEPVAGVVLRLGRHGSD